MSKVRIGIDVGGTFTDVVVIDNTTHELIGQLKIPTTHAAREGVALGIVHALGSALQKFAIRPDQVSFIAHSTTQATNALLEGDVARVGVIGMGRGLESWLARRATRVPPIPLSSATSLTAAHRFLQESDVEGLRELDRVLSDFARGGIQVVVASEAFGVDRNEGENLIAERARHAGLLATTGHEVSGLYGLRVRTRTAVINAAILPKMIETAEMTERCVRESGVRSPLMIMRSDGGVMSVSQVRRRPILTMLSGPAAGIAGALMHERVSDGIFIEVGGTSADVSVIRDGSPSMRPARLNGHRMYLNTLDVRTIGIAGGSMIRARKHAGHGHGILAVGPRSAHIAGLGYCCFADPDLIAGGRLEWIRPTKADSDDHVIVRAANGRGYAITTTCAANLLGLVRPENFACGNAAAARAAFDHLARELGGPGSAQAAAEAVLHSACRLLIDTIEGLIAEYHLDRSQVVLVGGGGGAAALIPYAAGAMKLEFRIARNAEVISPLGVAMAMIRDTVERNIVEPSPEDILILRREAAEAAIAAGAAVDSVEVLVEVDKRRNLVRAIAMGTSEIRRKEAAVVELSEQECRRAAAGSMRVDVGIVRLDASNEAFRVYSAERTQRTLMGMLHTKSTSLRVVDRTGVVRLQREGGQVSNCTVASIAAELDRVMELLTDFGDAGRAIPDIFLLYGGRIANFTGLADLPQVQALAEVELRSLAPLTEIMVLACPKSL